MRAARMPGLDAALLQPPPDLDCEFHGAGDERQKLDHEQRCFGQAAGAVHARLRALQKALGPSRPRIDKGLLRPRPVPNCRFTSTDAPDDRQKLDYQRQCFRQDEMIAHAQLRRLQQAVETRRRRSRKD